MPYHPFHHVLQIKLLRHDVPDAPFHLFKCLDIGFQHRLHVPVYPIMGQDAGRAVKTPCRHPHGIKCCLPVEHIDYLFLPGLRRSQQAVAQIRHLIRRHEPHLAGRMARQPNYLKPDAGHQDFLCPVFYQPVSPAHHIRKILPDFRFRAGIKTGL